MYSINRNVVVIKPKQPFLQWLNSLPDPDGNITEEDLKRDCTTYLIPETYSEEDAHKYIEDVFKEIFEIELVAWHRDRAEWPKRRTFKMFKEWFEIEVHSEVIDTVEGYIAKEDFHWKEELL